MRRALAVLLGALLLAACGSTIAAETPQQVVSTASQKMADLKTAKFDIDVTSLLQFPPQLAQSLGAQVPENLSIDVNGKGQMQLPSKAAFSMQVKTGGITVTTDAVIDGGKFYIKDPTSGNWMLAQNVPGLGQLGNQLDPTSANDVLKTVQSVKDLGDTTVGGTSVHHYDIVPDKVKLAQQLAGANADAQTQAFIQDVLNNGTIHVQVWIGKSDHLLRRLQEDLDGNIDLSKELGALGQSGQLPPGAIPTNASIHFTAHIKVDLHDFNSAVTVAIPSVSPS